MATKQQPAAAKPTLQAFSTESLLDELAARSDESAEENESTIGMLRLIERRGGHPGALAKAALLTITKSQDYNDGGYVESIHSIDRASYFPFGIVSYAQMLHTKAQRFNQLVKNVTAGRTPNHDGLRDTALDIINYAGFFIADDEASSEGGGDNA